ncbi:MAG: phenylacetic acid degradation bifunctional protein PaaZ [Candidatus Kapabacteria bacterium]|nr:phenylacetic acid degradation bifunctional protein PaaZ [Ignavibacteriota bacterium]MCW5883686.1 phenylacetic acid degradation bifunctional protein PaaZ [Candidatus Kapabacteria bacterium]
MKLKSYASGQWIEGEGSGTMLFHAVTGEPIGEISSKGVDFKDMLRYAREVGSPTLRKMTFHERARMLKALAQHLLSKKEIFYELSKATGATRTDSWIDIEGGIGTLFTYASKGRRELPDEPFLLEGNAEVISKKGTFIGHHICVPLEGAAIHINAFNFPIWGMLEKISPSLLAGLPAIVKPASLTAYLTELMVKEIIVSKILPEGALQLITGSAGDLLEHVTCQDVVTFTGSAVTGKMLKSSPAFLENSVRFNMEADSLNCSILGIDVTPDKEEFDLYIKEIVREMTVKAGQKCTAIRRAIVPENMVEPVINALKSRLAKNIIGNPDIENVRMGPLAGKPQVKEVRSKVEELMRSCELVSGSLDSYDIVGGNAEDGAFFPATLLYCNNPFTANEVHDIEAFGPVSTIIPYKTTEEAAILAKKGQGSLVGSIFTADNDVAKELFFGTASYHGRLIIINKDCAKESTGHGSPMPHLVHGGPGRAGGGEELGGIRSVTHYMQRTAIQGHPTTITKISNRWQKGAERREDVIHPFRKYFEELEIGDTLSTHGRTVTETDIVNFTGVSGDNFYAHTDVTSLEGTFFTSRVAHGYFVMSAAAGLFVDPKKGPVLANYGIDELRFTQPVYVGDTIRVNLTVLEKTAKEDKEGMPPHGVVKWDVEVFNQNNELVTQATILTLVAKKI